MPVENVTASVTIVKRVIEDGTDLFDLREELKAVGWFGALSNARNIDGSITGDFVQMTSPDSQQLPVKIGDVVVLINGVYAAMTSDEYRARYGEGA
jgi:sulfur transfer complex TusBCD TusB component (DsrH family)